MSIGPRGSEPVLTKQIGDLKAVLHIRESHRRTWANFECAEKLNAIFTVATKSQILSKPF